MKIKQDNFNPLFWKCPGCLYVEQFGILLLLLFFLWCVCCCLLKGDKCFFWMPRYETQKKKKIVSIEINFLCWMWPPGGWMLIAILGHTSWCHLCWFSRSLAIRMKYCGQCSMVCYPYWARTTVWWDLMQSIEVIRADHRSYSTLTVSSIFGHD